jgi:hypothetical protein
MPTLSASDYTQYLKFKAASISSIKPAIQTRDNVSTSQSLINANLLASQAALVSTSSVATAVRIATNSAVVTDALANVITSVADSSSKFFYTTTQAHGLLVGDTVTIRGLSQGTLNADPNVTDAVVSLVGSDTEFYVDGSGGGGGSGTGSGRIVGRVYYTTDVAHALSVGDLANVSGISTFTASEASVLKVPTTTTFVLSSTTTGTTVTGASGVLTTTVYTPRALALTSNVRVQGQQVVQQRANPNALSTLGYAGTSGALSSSRVQQPGGLPTGFKNSQGTYTRLPQNAGWIQGGAGNVSSGPKRF